MPVVFPVDMRWDTDTVLIGLDAVQSLLGKLRTDSEYVEQAVSVKDKKSGLPGLLDFFS